MRSYFNVLILNSTFLIHNYFPGEGTIFTAMVFKHE